MKTYKWDGKSCKWVVDKKSDFKWVIVDEDGNYWSGSYMASPYTRSARLFLSNVYCAKKYKSYNMAERSARKMCKSKVFGDKDRYQIQMINFGE
jgi:hypothetical protein